MSYCATCGRYEGLSKYHACPPEWEVRDAVDCDDDDWQIVREHDEEDAAAKYAEDCDDNGGEGPHERTVLVRAPGSSEVKRFVITFDYSVDYNAFEEPA
jgi:hypothetical protein